MEAWCNEAMPLDEKAHRKEYHKQYYQENKERISARIKKYQEANRDKLREVNKKWWLKNKEKGKSYCKRYCLKHPERRSETWKNYYYRNHARELERRRNYHRCFGEARKEIISKQQKASYRRHKESRLEKSRAYAAKNRKSRSVKNKAWRKNNPEWIANYRKNNRHVEICSAAKRRALKRGAEIDLRSIKEWTIRVKSSPAFRCYYCDGIFSSLDVHFDHVLPLSRFKIHKIENLCTACSACNLSKSDKLPSEWIEFGQMIFDI